MIISGTAAAAMAVTALVMVLTPGPNMMYLLSRSVAQGRGAGLISLSGTAVGFVVYLALANAGLAVVFVAVPWLFIGLKAAGALYLGYLAWKALRAAGSQWGAADDVRRDPSWKLFRMGLLTNLLNPKAAVMYLALIPQFIDPSAGHVAAQGLTLGGIQIAVSLAVNATIVVTASALAGLVSSRPRWITWQRRITGSALAAAALALAREVPARARV